MIDLFSTRHYCLACGAQLATTLPGEDPHTQPGVLKHMAWHERLDTLELRLRQLSNQDNCRTGAPIGTGMPDPQEP